AGLSSTSRMACAIATLASPSGAGGAMLIASTGRLPPRRGVPRPRRPPARTGGRAGPPGRRTIARRRQAWRRRSAESPPTGRQARERLGSQSHGGGGPTGPVAASHRGGLAPARETGPAPWRGAARRPIAPKGGPGTALFLIPILGARPPLDH